MPSTAPRQCSERSAVDPAKLSSSMEGMQRAQVKTIRVNDFRSVEDSGWIDIDEVTALIGTNESGKTNLLLPLWKLLPAKGGEIKPTSDFPRKHYNTFRNQETKPIFIRAVFESTPELADSLSKITGLPAEKFAEIETYRRLDGKWVLLTFPSAAPPETVESGRALLLFEESGNRNSCSDTDEIGAGHRCTPQSSPGNRNCQRGGADTPGCGRFDRYHQFVAR